MTSYLIRSDDWQALFLRLGLALLVGGAIGWNRERQQKSAGLRTHMLVSLGAALFVLTPLQADLSASNESVGRAIQGVATGIGFLGAGEILHVSRRNTPKVKGLTSAASIWVTAALGIAAGCGWWQLTTIAAVMTLITLSSVKKLEDSSWLRIDEDDHP
ncbi:MAG: MgtC/SapB family protein [Leptolyngbyaceae cyanobacterium SU_3_3]|nr:MgtC/SapB family protein [Leptolyngbyaceae cyanobacterium SU_3_3]NJR49927.1 MgtC/SapB family protein [Leptolyngbyaceae cyanobacterium CSU_1_3]